MLTKAEKKSLVLEFWDEYFTKGKLETLPKYVHKNYVQHIPSLPDGPEGFNLFMQKYGGTFPTEVKHVIADAERVAVHFQALGAEKPGHPLYGKRMAVVDILSTKDDKFYEHWFAVEPVPPHDHKYDLFSDVHTPLKDVTTVQEEVNRELITAVFTQAFAGDLAGLDKMMSDKRYIEHSFRPVSTRNLVAAYQIHYGSPTPAKGRVIFTIADGDLVLAYVSYVYAPDREIAVCHIFRMRDKKIIEHWDVHTRVPPPEDFKHSNGMY